MGWEITQKWANPYSTSGMGWEILQKWAFQGSIERDFWLMGWEIWQKWAFQTLSSEISDFMGWEIPLKWAFQSLSIEISDLWFEKSHRNEQFRRDFWLMCWEIIQKWTPICSVKNLSNEAENQPESYNWKSATKSIWNLRHLDFKNELVNVLGF